MRRLLRIELTARGRLRWVAFAAAPILCAAASVAGSDTLLSIASADTSSSGNVPQLHDDLRELNNKLARAISYWEAHEGAFSSPDYGHMTRTLTDLEATKLRAVSQFPQVFDHPYVETFTKLSCVDSDLEVAKQLVHELDRGYLGGVGKGYASLRVITMLKEAKDCKDTLEPEVGGSLSQSGSDDLRELNNKLARAISYWEAHEGAFSSPDYGHMTRTLTDLEATKLRAVSQFPQVFDHPYVETFTKLSCVDSDLEVAKQLVHELDRGYLGGVGKGYASFRVITMLKEAKDCKDTLELEIPISGTTTSPTTTTAHTKGYQCTGAESLLFDDTNGFAVENGGRPPSFNTGGKSYCVVLVITYHWNNGYGKAPGTIALKSGTGTLGPWKAVGSTGQGDPQTYPNGVPNANWTATPTSPGKPVVIDGTYTCEDSDPSTWSQNTQSGGRGFCKVWVEQAQVTG